MPLSSIASTCCAGGACRRRNARQSTCDSVLRDQGAATCLARHPQPGGAATYLLFAVRRRVLTWQLPDTSTVHHRSASIGSTAVSLERIVASNNAGLFDHAQFLRRSGTVREFAAFVAFAIRGDCHETVSIMSTPRTSPNRYLLSSFPSPSPPLPPRQLLDLGSR